MVSMSTGDQARVVLESFAIAEHPNAPFSTGHIETRPAMIERFDHYGAATLPVVPALAMKDSAAGAWFKRSWGRGYGFRIEGHKRGCPMVLHVEQGGPLTLHWMARAEIFMPVGGLTIAIDNSLGGSVAALSDATTTHPMLTTEEQLAEMPFKMRANRLMTGRAALMAHAPGFVQFVLTGNVSGVHVLWSAVSIGPRV